MHYQSQLWEKHLAKLRLSIVIDYFVSYKWNTMSSTHMLKQSISQLVVRNFQNIRLQKLDTKLARIVNLPVYVGL